MTKKQGFGYSTFLIIVIVAKSLGTNIKSPTRGQLKEHEAVLMDIVGRLQG